VNTAMNLLLLEFHDQLRNNHLLEAGSNKRRIPVVSTIVWGRGFISWLGDQLS
jgi:hypothetical protein